jgi:hypothetical protein
MHPSFPLPLIQALEPSEHKLLTLLCEQLSDAMISRMARADYGYGADSNFAELKQQISERTFPAHMSFGVHEVLQLTRWMNAGTEEELLARSYACVRLLHLDPETQYDETAESSSLIALVDAAIQLPAYRRPALQFVAWKVLDLYTRELDACFEDGGDESDVYIERYSLFALLLLMVLNDEPREHVRAIYEALTGYKNTAAEKSAVINDLLQDSGLKESLWKEIVSRLESAWLNS